MPVRDRAGGAGPGAGAPSNHVAGRRTVAVDGRSPVVLGRRAVHLGGEVACGPRSRRVEMWPCRRFPGRLGGRSRAANGRDRPTGVAALPGRACFTWRPDVRRSPRGLGHPVRRADGPLRAVRRLEVARFGWCWASAPSSGRLRVGSRWPTGRGRQARGPRGARFTWLPRMCRPGGGSSSGPGGCPPPRPRVTPSDPGIAWRPRPGGRRETRSPIYSGVSGASHGQPAWEASRSGMDACSRRCRASWPGRRCPPWSRIALGGGPGRRDPCGALDPGGRSGRSPVRGDPW